MTRQTTKQTANERNIYKNNKEQKHTTQKHTIINKTQNRKHIKHTKENKQHT